MSNTVALSITGVDRHHLVKVEVPAGMTVFQAVNDELWWFENHEDDAVQEAHFTHNGVTYVRLNEGPWWTKEELDESQGRTNVS